MRKFLKENSQSEDFTRWEWNRMLRKYGFKPVCIKPIEFTSPYLPARLIPTATFVSQCLEAIPLVKEFAGTLLIVARK